LPAAPAPALPRRPDGKGRYRITLPHDLLDKLNHVRGPGESYSDVIIRVARGRRLWPPFLLANCDSDHCATRLQMYAI
jgi:hypothetical protein